MLARTSWFSAPDAAPERDYSGYPIWFVLLTEPNREARAAGLLQKLNVHVYLPEFSKSCCRRGGLRYRRKCAVMPGLLFVPCELVEIDNRKEVFEWAHVGGFVKTGGKPIVLSKEDIEAIRRIEAKLNSPDKPVDARGREIEVGCNIRFIDPSKVRLFGEGVVFEVAHDRRIGITVSGLFGGPQKLYDHAVEIEVI